MKIPVQFETESRGELRDYRRKFTAKSDGTNPKHECDDIYVGDGKCVCWRCGKESMLAATPNGES